MSHLALLPISKLHNKPTARHLSLMGFLLAVLAVLSACSGQAAPASAQSYIATIDGAPASARVGIVVEAGQFAAYVCSLDDGFNTTSARWYTGTVDASGNVSGVSPDGVAFKGTIQNGQFNGSLVNTDKVTWNFKGALVPPGTQAGLYRGTGQYNGQDVVVGAVFSTDGSFASTTQYKGKIEFVTPVGDKPANQKASSLDVLLGPAQEPHTVTLVGTLKGVQLF